MSASETHPIGQQGHRRGLQELASLLGYESGPSQSLEAAFTHRSYANESLPKVPHNERLEFLGDAVLDLVVAECLMLKFPDVAEGELHRLRTTLVCTESLAQFARSLGLGRLLRLGKGELRANGRKKDSLLANAFEAMVGAVYLDHGFDFAKTAVLNLMSMQLAAVEVGGALGFDPKSRLQEKCQQLFGRTPVYRLVESRGPEHAKEFVVEVLMESIVRGTGVGRSKKNAEREAAKVALESWDEG